MWSYDIPVRCWAAWVCTDFPVTDLCTETSSTVQVLREAHILMRRSASLTHLPIVLTNSVVWSFGLAERVPKDKMKVTKYFQVARKYATTSSVLEVCGAHVVQPY